MALANPTVAFAATASVQVVLPAGPRLGAGLYNASAVPVYIGLGFDPSAAQCVYALDPKGYFEIPYGAAIQDVRIRASAADAGKIMITEYVQ